MCVCYLTYRIADFHLEKLGRAVRPVDVGDLTLLVGAQSTDKLASRELSSWKLLRTCCQAAKSPAIEVREQGRIPPSRPTATSLQSDHRSGSGTSRAPPSACWSAWTHFWVSATTCSAADLGQCWPDRCAGKQRPSCGGKGRTGAHRGRIRGRLRGRHLLGRRGHGRQELPDLKTTPKAIAEWTPVLASNAAHLANF